MPKAAALPDIHVFSVPKATWQYSSASITHALRQTDGVLRVDVQEPRKRAKRGKLNLFTRCPVIMLNR